MSGKEKKEFFFPRGPLVDERASESRPAILSAAPECALFCDRFSRPELAVSGPLLLSSFRQTSRIDVFEQLLIGIEECKEEKEHLSAER